jgi:hypothetical protein
MAAWARCTTGRSRTMEPARDAGGAARGNAKRQSVIRTPGRAVVFPSGELAHDVGGVLVPAQALEAGVA